MTNIGFLDEVQNNGEKEFWGELKTLHHHLKLRLAPNKEFGGSERAPDYYIFTRNSSGGEAQIGNAWMKPLNNPTSDAREFLSITIDDVSFIAPINVAAFPKGKQRWEISWRRRKTNLSNESN